MFLERPLDAAEIRVLGVLLEKQLTTPDIYPLTLNALVSGANQKTNRDPVMELSSDEVSGALERLRSLHLVFELNTVGRVPHYDHRLDGRWGLTSTTRALMALLMLRGAQTAGELRSRSSRLHEFASVEEVEAELRYLASGDEALVRELEKRPGQKETRWAHLVGETVEPTPSASTSAPTPVAESLTSRIERLEQAVESLERELADLRKALGD